MVALAADQREQRRCWSVGFRHRVTDSRAARDSRRKSWTFLLGLTMACRGPEGAGHQAQRCDQGKREQRSDEPNKVRSNHHVTCQKSAECHCERERYPPAEQDWAGRDHVSRDGEQQDAERSDEPAPCSKDDSKPFDHFGRQKLRIHSREPYVFRQHHGSDKQEKEPGSECEETHHEKEPRGHAVEGHDLFPMGGLSAAADSFSSLPLNEARPGRGFAGTAKPESCTACAWYFTRWAPHERKTQKADSWPTRGASSANRRL